MPYANKVNAIYRIVNKKTGVCYVGQSQNVRKRLKEHMRMLRAGIHDNIHLQRAFVYYGEDAFEPGVEVLCEDTADLDAIEEAFLTGEARFDTPCVYNIAAFSKAPMRGKVHDEATKKRISEKRKNAKFDYSSQEYRERLSKAQRKRFLDDPEFVAKLRFILENEHMSYAARGRALGADTSSVRKLAKKHAHFKGVL